MKKSKNESDNFFFIFVFSWLVFGNFPRMWGCGTKDQGLTRYRMWECGMKDEFSRDQMHRVELIWALTLSHKKESAWDPGGEHGIKVTKRNLKCKPRVQRSPKPGFWFLVVLHTCCYFFDLDLSETKQFLIQLYESLRAVTRLTVYRPLQVLASICNFFEFQKNYPKFVNRSVKICFSN